MINNAPSPVMGVLNRLTEAGHSAYLVGGCVRDHLLGRTPKDYDVTTGAHPEEVTALFPKVIPTGIRYGTVTVMAEDTPIEVTTFRADGKYSDGRRPDVVTFGSSIEEDLARRDFTMNAMAWSPVTGLIDPFGGANDLAAQVVRAVGDPAERFQEDALRMLRAIRFATVLGFILDLPTGHQIQQNAHLIQNVSAERIREELNRILVSRSPDTGLTWLNAMNLLPEFLPELARCAGFDQRNPHHRFDVLEHIKRVTAAVPPVLHLRLAAMLHDVAKPATFTQVDGFGHFYGHDDMGAQMAQTILERLKYDRETITRVVHLVQHHMFSADMGTKAIRRFVARVSAETVPDLLTLREADVRGSGVPEDLTHTDRIRTVMAEMQTAGIANPARDLAVNGHDIMDALGICPGKRVGAILKALTDRVLDEPALNQRETLLALLPEVAS